MSTSKAREIVKKYAERLRTENYPFSAIYLFGSHARGQAAKFSDIDVAVISDKLKRDWNRNEDMLWRHTMKVNSRIEPLGFTPEDFKNNTDPMVAEIKRTGIRIA